MDIQIHVSTAAFLIIMLILVALFILPDLIDELTKRAEKRRQGQTVLDTGHSPIVDYGD